MALVSDSEIGENTKIWQFASVIRGSVIGDGCVIASNTVIDGASIGDESRIGSLCSINPGVVIGRGCFVGPGSVMCNDMWPRVDKAHFAIGTTIIVEDGASIGANVTVLPGIVIGGSAMVAAGVTVICDVPAGHLYHGEGLISPITEERRKLETRCRCATRHYDALEA